MRRPRSWAPTRRLVERRPTAAPRRPRAALDPRQRHTRSGISRKHVERGTQMARGGRDVSACELELRELDVAPRSGFGLPAGRVERESHRRDRAPAIPGQLARVGDPRVRRQVGTERDHALERGESLAIPAELDERVSDHPNGRAEPGRADRARAGRARAPSGTRAGSAPASRGRASAFASPGRARSARRRARLAIAAGSSRPRTRASEAGRRSRAGRGDPRPRSSASACADLLLEPGDRLRRHASRRPGERPIGERRGSAVTAGDGSADGDSARTPPTRPPRASAAAMALPTRSAVVRLIAESPILLPRLPVPRVLVAAVRSGDVRELARNAFSFASTPSPTTLFGERLQSPRAAARIGP